MDTLCNFDWYDLMWYWFMYELADGNEGTGEPIPPLTGDNNKRRQRKH